VQEHEQPGQTKKTLTIWMGCGPRGSLPVGDAKLVLQGGISGVPRIARHLWRMCLGLTMAAGSFFTNALPRLLPPPMHVTPIVFVPQLLLLGFLVFWMFRVRFAGRGQLKVCEHQGVILPR
jgi:hypothetical protein